MQASELMHTLRIGEAEALKILDEVAVSSEQAGVTNSTERDDIEEFSFALKEMLDEHREAVHASDGAPSKPVVSFKKRHRIVYDAVPSRVH
jgi:hypothetical protein